MATAPSNQQPQGIRELCRGHLSFLDAHQEKRNEAYSTPSFHDNALTKCGQKKIRFKVGRGKKKWKKQTGYIHTYVYIYTYMHIYISIYIHIFKFVEGTFMSYFGLLAASTKFSHHGTSGVLFAAFCVLDRLTHLQEIYRSQELAARLIENC